MGMPGTWELLIILVVVILIFGTKKLKNIGGDLGGAIKSFRRSMRDADEEKPNETTPSAQVSQDESGKVIEGKITAKEHSQSPHN